MGSKKRRMREKLMYQLVVTNVILFLFSYLFVIVAITFAFHFEEYEFSFARALFHPTVTFSVIIFLGLNMALIFFFKFSKKFLKPIHELKKGMDQVKNGNFNIRIENEFHNETQDLINNFNLMVEELQKSETLKSDFISNVSHEFKTPLSSIQGYATLLQDESLSKEDKDKYTKYIIDSTQKLNVLISNILKISKIDNQKIVIEQELFELDEQIREVVLSLEKEWTNKNIELDIDLDEVSIRTDKTLLSHVWSNIIGNAIKYSYDNSKIEIKLRNENDKIKVTIKDYGIGIEEEKIPYIFNKFYQGDTSHSNEGNGLGLALVKGIVDLINGKIEVHSEVNKGTEFIVTLNK